MEPRALASQLIQQSLPPLISNERKVIIHSILYSGTRHYFLCEGPGKKQKKNPWPEFTLWLRKMHKMSKIQVRLEW